MVFITLCIILYSIQSVVVNIILEVMRSATPHSGVERGSTVWEVVALVLVLATVWIAQRD